jgi:hypothetical protein
VVAYARSSVTEPNRDREGVGAVADFFTASQRLGAFADLFTGSDGVPNGHAGPPKVMKTPSPEPHHALSPRTNSGMVLNNNCR